MIRKNQRLLNFFHGLSDGLLIILSYFGVMFFRFEVLGSPRRMDLLSEPYIWIAAVYSLLTVLAYAATRMYSSHRLRKSTSDIFKIFLINGIASLALMSTFYLLRVTEFPRLTVILFWLFSSLLVIAKRLVLWAVLHHYRSLGYNQKRIVIVGNGHLAKQYLKNIEENPQLGITAVGYVSKAERPELGRCLGSYEDLEEILAEQKIDELVVALEPHETQFMKPVLAAADKEGVRLSLIPFYNDYIPSNPSIDVIGETKLIDMRATPLDNIGWAMVKRAMDIAGSLVLILVSSPIMLVTAIGVKLSSPGPVLFKQERIGKDKKPFQMLKFRSMRVNGEEATGWSTDSDPRKTKFGSFIRKTSIDELPQAFNVLCGQMSLVGPRPEIPYHVQHFKEEIPLYLVRQQVRPGITGWAQVNGLRGDTSIEDRVEHDLWYIENWSLGLDIKILFKTAFGGMVNKEKVIIKKGEGAEPVRAAQINGEMLKK